MSDSPQIVQAVPQIPAEDVQANIDFYVQKLGFELDFAIDGYAGVKRDGALIHIYHHADRGLAEMTMYRIVVTGVHALAETFQKHGVKCEVKQQPWGTLDLAVIDTAGNCLTFYEDPS